MSALTHQPPSAVAYKTPQTRENTGAAWEVVRVDERMATRVLRLLGGRTGAVIQNPSVRQPFWLVSVRTVSSRQHIPGKRVLGDGSYVPSPQLRDEPDPLWRLVKPFPHQNLASARPLHGTIAEAIR